MINDNLSQQNYWEEAWVRHIETYLAATPRCGIWIKSWINVKTDSILECAGGSCRDSRFLYNNGYQAVGSDFDKRTLKYIQDKFKNSAFKMLDENAFKLSHLDKSVDVVFHNGFWVCFDNDEKITELFLEQCRVCRRHAIILVHNKNNSKLIGEFKNKSLRDDLYKIRFFNTVELEQIVKRSQIQYKSIHFAKFGGPVDILYSVEKWIPPMSAFVRWLVPRIYKFQPWSRVERIAMIVNLQK